MRWVRVLSAVFLAVLAITASLNCATSRATSRSPVDVVYLDRTNVSEDVISRVYIGNTDCVVAQTFQGIAIDCDDDR